ncbi:hypothetical protein VTO73DRAFT_6695 [Trametes versicolor]
MLWPRAPNAPPRRSIHNAWGHLQSTAYDFGILARHWAARLGLRPPGLCERPNRLRGCTMSAAGLKLSELLSRGVSVRLQRPLWVHSWKRGAVTAQSSPPLFGSSGELGRLADHSTSGAASKLAEPLCRGVSTRYQRWQWMHLLKRGAVTARASPAAGKEHRLGACVATFAAAGQLHKRAKRPVRTGRKGTSRTGTTASSQVDPDRACTLGSAQDQATSEIATVSSAARASMSRTRISQRRRAGGRRTTL